MKNNGLISVGHLVTVKSHTEVRRTFESFSNILTGFMSEKYIRKCSSKEMLNEFFKNLEPNTLNFAKFLSFVLRTHGSDTLEFELRIEKFVWDMVQHEFLELLRPSVSKETLYKLFCIFNRFCDFQTDLLWIGEKATAYLFLQLGMAEPKNPRLSFDEFLFEVVERRDTFVLSSIEKLFDTLVRDIMLEGEIKIRIASRSAGFSFTQAYVVKKLVVHSQFINIMPEKSDDEEFVEEKFYLVSAISYVGKYKPTLTKFMSGSLSALTIVNSEKVMELNFHPKNNSDKIRIWSETIGAAINFANKSSTLLDKVKSENDIDPNNPQVDAGSFTKTQTKKKMSTKNSFEGEMFNLMAIHKSASTADLSNPNNDTFKLLTGGQSSDDIFLEFKAWKKMHLEGSPKAPPRKPKRKDSSEKKPFQM